MKRLRKPEQSPRKPEQAPVFYSFKSMIWMCFMETHILYREYAWRNATAIHTLGFLKSGKGNISKRPHPTSIG